MGKKVAKRKRPLAKPVGVFCADLHLDLNAWSSRPELRGDSMWSFEYILSRALEIKADFVCAAGDLFDVRKPPSEVIRFFREAMEDIASFELPFYYIQGQHGLADPPWPSSAHSWPVHLHQQPVELPFGQTMYAMDWTPADRLADALASIPEDTDLFVCHQVWGELMGALLPCEGSLTAIPHATTVFTGDYHDTITLEGTGATGQPMKIYSPGSTNMRKVDEPPRKYFYVFREDGRWTKHRIPTRPVIKVKVVDERMLDEFVTGWEQRLSELEISDILPVSLCKPILWFQFYEDVAGALAKAQGAVKDSAFVFPKVLVHELEEEELTLTRKQREEVVEAGLAGCLPLLVPQEDQHYGSLLRLLESKDPAAELLGIREERLSQQKMAG